MDTELIRRHDGYVTHLTLNRPHKANALSAPLAEALLDAVEYAYTDGTRLLVLDGNGGHFCAGFDFTGYLDAAEGDLVLRFIRIETLLQLLFHAPFATLALAHGKIFGAGADLIAACSQRVAAHGTTFRMPGLRFGVVLGTRRLAHRVGTDAARRLLATSRTFDADAALQCGFLTQVASHEAWPQLIAAATTDTQALNPLALKRLHQHTVPDMRAADMAALVASVSVPGLKERIRQFRESP